MAEKKTAEIKVETFRDYQVITQPNPLRKHVRRVDEKDKDDPVARAEKALASLSGEFKGWMLAECERLSAAHAAVKANGMNMQSREELFRAAHDIKGDAATFGYPTAAAAAESLCRIIEHAPDLDAVPDDLIAHHVNAIHAIFREQAKIEATGMANELSKRLRGLADEYLITVNRDRPEHLDAILSPSIAPAE
ncbi:MAG: Hpt domain-containing protein [Rhizobiales bacterium]|nr:Hpt domain-containing protein [Hyphomicrobiales bacterium]